MIDSRTRTLVDAQLRSLHLASGNAQAGLPLSATLTGLMRHGGIHTLADVEIMASRLTAMASTAQPAMNVPFLASVIQGVVTNFFYHLVDDTLSIPQNLMSYLTFPEDGRTHTRLTKFKSSPTNLPAAFTFIGQFIDHDLTMNAINLFDSQTGVVLDKASPLIDLDSVYGPRQPPAAPLFVGDKFALSLLPNNVFDYVRDPTGKAMIADNRNDENQIISQIQILIMRLHNAFVDAGMDMATARQNVLFNWQSVILNDYLPQVIDADVLASVIAALDAKDYAKLKHHPLEDLATGALVVGMPHEFAIGFRFGHSQLRDFYQLNPNHPPNPQDHDRHVVRLFDNRNPEADDLRGGKVLSANHAIDWPFFLDAAGHADRISNRIDSKVTDVVFDLPASAIPDDIKFVSNLPLRNLIRSHQIGLSSGEALAAFYDPGNALQPPDIEPHPDARKFFKDDGDNSAQPAFQTPLWYYILKEAEKAAEGHFGQNKIGFLGPVGSRLVAEVIAGGIYYNPASRNVTLNPAWQSTIATGPDKRKVKFIDIVAKVV